MSIINDMLKDLEQRKTSNAADNTFSQSVKSMPAGPRNIAPAKWLLLIVMIAAVMIVYWKTQKTQPAESMIETPVPVAVAPAIATPEPESFAEGLPNSVSPAQPELTEDTAPVDTVIDDVTAAPSLRMETTLTDNSLTAKTLPNSTKTQDSQRKTALELPATINKPETNNSAVTQPGASTTSAKSANKQLVSKKVSPEQQSANHYRQAISYLQQGRVVESEAQLQRALEVDPKNHDARQMLVSLKLDAQRHTEAMSILETGIQVTPQQFGFNATLARLQINSGQLELALSTLESGLSYAGNNADYHALLAASLQRNNQHEKAIQHYLTALRANPLASTWLVGLGISMQANAQFEDAQLAFQRAQSTGTLSAEMAVFVEQRLKQIRQQLTRNSTHQ